VNVGSPGSACAAMAQIAAESTPPERNAPTGTSLRKCAPTESRSAVRMRSGVSADGDLAGRRTGRQYRNDSTGPPGLAVR